LRRTSRPCTPALGRTRRCSCHNSRCRSRGTRSDLRTRPGRRRSSARTLQRRCRPDRKDRPGRSRRSCWSRAADRRSRPRRSRSCSSRRGGRRRGSRRRPGLLPRRPVRCTPAPRRRRESRFRSRRSRRRSSSRRGTPRSTRRQPHDSGLTCKSAPSGKPGSRSKGTCRRVWSSPRGGRSGSRTRACGPLRRA